MTWTAAASGGVGPLQYQFRAFNAATGTWTTIRDYAPTASTTWSPLSPGTHTVEVRVRSAGSTAAYQALRQVTRYTVFLSGMNPVALTPNQVFPVAPTTPVTWTAAIASGTQPALYQFLWRPTSSSTWTVGRAYSSSPTWTWTPASAGSYQVQVWGKETWFPGEYLTYQQTGTLSVTAGPIGSVGLTASQSVPLTSGQPIVWTASATGGTTRLEYLFWMRDYNTDVWTIVQNYGPNRSWAWTAPTAFGQYAVHVWIRPVGSTAGYERYAVFGPFTVTP